MAGQPRLGVPENAVLSRQAAGAFDTYAQLLTSHADEFDAAELSVSSIETFETRVREIAKALTDEAEFLRNRSTLSLSTGPAASALGSESGRARRERV